MCFWKPLGLNSFSWNWKLHLETYDKACFYACYIIALSNPPPPPWISNVNFIQLRKKKVIQFYRMYTTGDQYSKVHRLQASIKA